ncbi:hypothetical protein [Spongiactinospora rosea]|uniref:hypothetical protein n=1 Tax=Spongiactinospora rosea TaxID=2248750 RepID=UPI001CECAAC0|nr:hypothetical protein [Spongiactinospora rosea]
MAFIGVRLVLHWAHGIWARVPEISTLASLGVIVAVLLTVTLTSLRADRASRAGGRGRREPVCARLVGLCPAREPSHLQRCV